MVRRGNSSVLNVHNTRAGSCCARIVSVALDFVVLCHSLALSITVPLLSFSCSFFSLPSSQGPHYHCGCLSLMEMFALPAPWPGVCHFSQGKHRKSTEPHTFGGDGGLCVLEATSGDEFSEGAGRGTPPSEEILCSDLSPKSTLLVLSPH